MHKIKKINIYIYILFVLNVLLLHIELHTYLKPQKTELFDKSEGFSVFPGSTVS